MGFFHYNTEPQPLSVIKIFYGTLVRWHTSVIVIERRLKKDEKLGTSFGYRMIPWLLEREREREKSNKPERILKPFMEMKIPCPLRGPLGAYLQGLTHFIFVYLGFTCWMTDLLLICMYYVSVLCILSDNRTVGSYHLGVFNISVLLRWLSG